MTWNTFGRRLGHKLKEAVRREKLIAILGGKCVKCESTKNLQFDHINPKTKLFEINQKLRYKFEYLLKEVTKCQLLCISCHTGKTNRERVGKI